MFKPNLTFQKDSRHVCRWSQWREGVARGAYYGVLFAPLPGAAPGVATAAPTAAPTAAVGMVPAPAPSAPESTAFTDDGSMLATADSSLAGGDSGGGSADRFETGGSTDGNTIGGGAARRLLGGGAATASGQDTGSAVAGHETDGDGGDTAAGSSTANSGSDGAAAGKATLIVKPCPWCRHPAEQAARTAFLVPAADFHSSDLTALLYVKEAWRQLQAGTAQRRRKRRRK